MSVWRTFKGWFAGSLKNPDEGFQGDGPVIGRTEGNIQVTDERAMQISTVFACVRTIVNAGAPLPLAVYERNSDGRNRLENHYLCELLKFRPNPIMTAKEFRMAMWTQRVLWGNAYALITRSPTGQPTQLLPLSPASMDVKRTGGGVEYHYTTNTGTIVYPADRILHIKGFSPDGVMGLSPLAHARQSMGIAVAADQRAAREFSGKPNGVLTTDQILTQEQRDKLRNIYGGIESTSQNASDGKWWLLEGGFKWQDVGLPPDDLQMLQTRAHSVPDICRYFGVPAVMIDGNQGAVSAWPASYEQQVLSFLTFTLKPYVDEWEDKISYSLLPAASRSRIFVEHNFEGLLRTDSAARATFYSTMSQNGLMTRNEIRKKENLPPVEGGDELTVQVNLTPIDQLASATNVAQNRQPT